MLAALNTRNLTLLASLARSNCRDGSITLGSGRSVALWDFCGILSAFSGRSLASRANDWVLRSLGLALRSGCLLRGSLAFRFWRRRASLVLLLVLPLSGPHSHLLPGLGRSGLLVVHVLLVEQCLAVQRLITEDVVSPLQLLPEPHSRYLIDGHVAHAILLCETALARGLLKVVPDLVPGFLVLLPEVPLIQPLLIFNLHIDRIIHEPLILNRNRQLLDLILAMNLGILLPLLQVLILLFLVVVVAVDRVEVVSLPVSLGCLSLQNLLIRQQLLVMVLQVLV